MLEDELGLSRLKRAMLLLLILLPIKFPDRGLALPPLRDPCKACNAWAGVLVNCLGDTRCVSLYRNKEVIIIEVLILSNVKNGGGSKKSIIFKC